MKVNGLNIDAEPERILYVLKDSLHSNSFYLLKQIKPLRDNIQFTCPFHSGGNENKPSCGMSVKTVIKGGRAVPAGTVHCFTCGYNSDLTNFISNCFGRQDSGFFGNQWIKKHFTSEVEVNRDRITFERRKGRSSSTSLQRQVVRPIKEKELETYRFYHDYMYQRGLTDEIINIFDVGFDQAENCLTFPVRNEDGETIFINRRSVATKFHKYGESDPKTEYVYGMYELLQYYPDATEVIVTESIIDCLILWTYELPAVSLMGLGGGLQYDILKKSKIKSIVLGLDPDEAGFNAMEKAAKILSKSKLVNFLEYPPDAYENELDIGDLKDRIDELLISPVLNFN